MLLKFRTKVFFPYNMCYVTKLQKGFPGGSAVKNSSAIQETWVRSLGQEDPLEKKMASQSSVLAWEIAWTEEPGRLQSMGSQKSQTQLKRQSNNNRRKYNLGIGEIF